MSQNPSPDMPDDDKTSSQDTLDLIHAYAKTWEALAAYDAKRFPKTDTTLCKVEFTIDEFIHALTTFKQQQDLTEQSSARFGEPCHSDALTNIFDSVLQPSNGRDKYPSIEKKAANLLYLIVKNRPFQDGNKRIGAFAFIWLLRKAGILRDDLPPIFLTALTTLVAESGSDSKSETIKIILLVLLAVSIR